MMDSKYTESNKYDRKKVMKHITKYKKSITNPNPKKNKPWTTKELDKISIISKWGENKRKINMRNKIKEREGVTDWNSNTLNDKKFEGKTTKGKNGTEIIWRGNEGRRT